MSDESPDLDRRWAVLGLPIATAIMVIVGVVYALWKDSDPANWRRPVILAMGSPMLLIWWHWVVRPRHRWWALGSAIVVITIAYQILYRLVLPAVPWPWDGVTSFVVASWAGCVVYVFVTRRVGRDLAVR